MKQNKIREKMLNILWGAALLLVIFDVARCMESNDFNSLKGITVFLAIVVVGRIIYKEYTKAKKDEYYKKTVIVAYRFVLIAVMLFIVIAFLPEKYASNMVGIIVYVILDGILTYSWENKFEYEKAIFKSNSEREAFNENYYDLYNNTTLRRVKLMLVISSACLQVASMIMYDTGAMENNLFEFVVLLVAFSIGILASAVIINWNGKFKVIDDICFRKKDAWWEAYDDEDKEDLIKLTLPRKELLKLQRSK